MTSPLKAKHGPHAALLGFLCGPRDIVKTKLHTVKLKSNLPKRKAYVYKGKTCFLENRLILMEIQDILSGINNFLLELQENQDLL